MKTSNLVNFVWQYCIENVVKLQKGYGFGEILSTNCMKWIYSNQKFWYYKIILSSTTPMISLMLSFMSAKDRSNLYICTAALYWKCNVFILD